MCIRDRRNTQKYFDSILEYYHIGGGQQFFLVHIYENNGITMYDLAKLSPSAVPVGERMAGIVRKVLQEDPCPGHPLNWVKREDGAKLIEALKRYLRNTKRKAAKHDSG